MSEGSPKSLVFEQFALVAKALGSRHRLELLDVLVQGERSVERLASAAGLNIGNASQHLKELRRVGLVSSRKVGTQVIYSLADAEVITLVRTLWHVAERNVAEVGRIVQHYYQSRDELEPVSRDELRKRIREKSVLVVDVRPADEYAAAHLPGAVGIPVSELKRRLKAIPKGREIVACCRGPYCVYSYEAVEILRAAGFRARRLDGGFLEWRVAGLPTTQRAGEVRS
jgi:rhodanese-related sulfurtransferase/DNA-binding HxlR family transcriptional regulator